MTQTVSPTLTPAPFRRRTAPVVAALTAGLIGFTAPAITPLQAQTTAAIPGETTARPGFADLVEDVLPAVVSIRVEHVEKGPGSRRPMLREFGLPPGHPMERFFRGFGDRLQPDASPGAPPNAPMRRMQAQGSGFIISPDGYIVTNNHVIADGESIMAVLSDGTRMDATLIGADEKTDLALLKVTTDSDLPHVSFRNEAAADLRTGDWVIAVGNPFGLGGTVTGGIVSARGRDIGTGPYDDFIQIDAAINRGSSGGPAFDLNGNVVGVNTAIYAPAQGNVGIGFAIPADLARQVVAELRDKGRVERGWLGVRIQRVDDEIADGLGLEETMGALVTDAITDTPAHTAGVRSGDIITAVNGEAIDDVRDLSWTIAGIDAGSQADITLWRDGETLTLPVTIAAYPEEDVAIAEVETQSPGLLGMTLESGEEGVMVTSVDPASEAADKGLRPGDVILMVGGEAVSIPADVAGRIEAAKSGERGVVVMLVNGRRGRHYVALRVT